MEGIEETPVAAETGGDFDSIINEALGPETPEETPVETPEPEQAEPEVKPDIPKLEVPGDKEGEPEKEEEGGEEEEEKLFPDELDEDDLKPTKVEGKLHFYPKQKADRLLQNTRDIQALREAFPGVSVEMVKEYAESANTMAAMLNDYQSGDPERLKGFTDYWFGEKANPRAAAQIAASLPATLAKTNPAALSIIENQVKQEQINQLMRDFQRSGGKDDETYALAFHLNKRLNGTDLQRGTGQMPQNDVVAAERAQLQRERKEFEDRQIAVSREQEQRVDAEHISYVGSAVDAHFDERLKPIKGKFDGEVYEAIKQRLTAKYQEYYQSNPTALQRFNAKREAARRSPTAQSREDLAAMCKQVADTVLRKHANAVIKSFTGTQVNANKEVREKQKTQQQAKRNAPPASVPTSRAIDVGKMIADGKMNEDEAFDALMGK